ncbi:hypothetical protein M0813_11646 [Anaeramoeba flamelloides]|uniref:Uncharacterized protein n=1 Tax=Anaeramoeba flamelloides TaxID=1746091 RepID=A0ABQ8ZE91_9EUKA|nr:hypothetical protein M0813_11646 [Anaeramoeba flamelloides]
MSKENKSDVKEENSIQQNPNKKLTETNSLSIMTNSILELAIQESEPTGGVLSIGPFHYQCVNLENVLDEIKVGIVNSGIICFYIPPDDLTYENEKVITRWLWSSGKGEYTIQSDIVPIVIHSSHFVPKKNPQQPNYGIIANFQYFEKKVTRLEMKRKNGIRSRFSSKETNHLVKILNTFVIKEKNNFPPNLFESTRSWLNFSKKIDLYLAANCSKKYLKMAIQRTEILNNLSLIDPNMPPLTRSKSRELSLKNNTHEKERITPTQNIEREFEKEQKKDNPKCNKDGQEEEQGQGQGKAQEKEKEKEQEDEGMKVQDFEFALKKVNVHLKMAKDSKPKTPSTKDDNISTPNQKDKPEQNYQNRNFFDLNKIQSTKKHQLVFQLKRKRILGKKEPNENKFVNKPLGDCDIENNLQSSKKKFANNKSNFCSKDNKSNSIIKLEKPTNVKPDLVCFNNTNRFYNSTKQRSSKKFRSQNEKHSNSETIVINKNNIPNSRPNLKIGGKGGTRFKGEKNGNQILINRNNYSLKEIEKCFSHNPRNVPNALKTHAIYLETETKRYEICLISETNIRLSEVRKPQPFDQINTNSYNNIPYLSKNLIILKYNLEWDRINWFENSILFKDLMIHPISFFFLRRTKGY